MSTVTESYTAGDICRDEPVPISLYSLLIGGEMRRSYQEAAALKWGGWPRASELRLGSCRRAAARHELPAVSRRYVGSRFRTAPLRARVESSALSDKSDSSLRADVYASYAAAALIVRLGENRASSKPPAGECWL